VQAFRQQPVRFSPVEAAPSGVTHVRANAVNKESSMLRHSKPFLMAVTFALLSLAAVSATKAAPAVHVNRASFDTVVPSYSTINFNGASAPLSNSLTYSGVTFAGAPGFQVEVIDGGNVGAPGNFVLISNTNQPSFLQNNIVITPLSGTRAFGFDLKSANNPGGNYQVTFNLADGTSLTQAVAVPTFNSFSFIGLTSDTDITSVTIRALSGGDPVIDNVSFTGNAPADVPEPATLVLLGTGLAGAAGAARKRRRHVKYEAADARDV
jgi:hypothetical protein